MHAGIDPKLWRQNQKNPFCISTQLFSSSCCSHVSSTDILHNWTIRLNWLLMELNSLDFSTSVKRWATPRSTDRFLPSASCSRSGRGTFTVIDRQNQPTNLRRQHIRPCALCMCISYRMLHMLQVNPMFVHLISLFICISSGSGVATTLLHYYSLSSNFILISAIHLESFIAVFLYSCDTIAVTYCQSTEEHLCGSFCYNEPHYTMMTHTNNMDWRSASFFVWLMWCGGQRAANVLSITGTR